MGVILGRSPFGQISGKLGEGVGVNWRGMSLVRSAPLISNRKSSGKQVVQQKLFKAVNGFLASVPTAIIRLGFQQTKGSKFSAMNRAASYHMLNAVKRVDKDWILDFKKIKFTRPVKSICEGWNYALEEVDGGLKISWELNPFPEKATQLDDEAIVLCYYAGDKDFREAIELTGIPDQTNVKRSELALFIPSRRRTSGYDIDFWIFFVSSDGKRVSETTYLGMLKMPEMSKKKAAPTDEATSSL